MKNNEQSIFRLISCGENSNPEEYPARPCLEIACARWNSQDYLGASACGAVLAHPITHQFPETRSDQPPTHLKTSPWGTVDRGKDTLAIRVTQTLSLHLGCCPVSRSQRPCDSNLVLLPRYGNDLKTPSSDNPQRPQDSSYHTNKRARDNWP